MVLNGVILPEAGLKILTSAAHVLAIPTCVSESTSDAGEMMQAETSSLDHEITVTLLTLVVKLALTTHSLLCRTMAGVLVTTPMVIQRAHILRLKIRSATSVTPLKEKAWEDLGLMQSMPTMDTQSLLNTTTKAVTEMMETETSAVVPWSTVTLQLLAKKLVMITHSFLSRTMDGVLVETSTTCHKTPTLPSMNLNVTSTAGEWVDPGLTQSSRTTNTSQETSPPKVTNGRPTVKSHNSSSCKATTDGTDSLESSVAKEFTLPSRKDLTTKETNTTSDSHSLVETTISFTRMTKKC
jgi:hypothetical protein